MAQWSLAGNCSITTRLEPVALVDEHVGQRFCASNDPRALDTVAGHPAAEGGVRWAGRATAAARRTSTSNCSSLFVCDDDDEEGCGHAGRRRPVRSERGRSTGSSHGGRGKVSCSAWRRCYGGRPGQCVWESASSGSTYSHRRARTDSGTLFRMFLGIAKLDGAYARCWRLLCQLRVVGRSTPRRYMEQLLVLPGACCYVQGGTTKYRCWSSAAVVLR